MCWSQPGPTPDDGVDRVGLKRDLRPSSDRRQGTRWIARLPAAGGSRKFDGDGGLRQPPTANSTFSRITFSSSSRGNSGSRSGVIAWRNSRISVRQSSSVRSRGHSAASGSQQVTGASFHRFRRSWARLEAPSRAAVAAAAAKVDAVGPNGYSGSLKKIRATPISLGGHVSSRLPQRVHAPHNPCV
jgi:hypothetical protein